MELPRVLDVMTLNVWGLPWPFASDRSRRWARLASHFRRVEYDLVGVQEAWWPLGRRLAIPGLRLPAGWRDSGLGLAGRLAAAGRHELRRFDRATGADRLAAKGLLVATLGALTVGVTHLQAGDATDVRADQVAQIVGWLGAVEGPVLLMGDFNFAGSDDAASEAALARAGLVDAAGGGAATFVPRNPFTGRAAPSRLDRIYVRDGTAQRWQVHAVRVLPRVWSDHQPLHARLWLA